MNCLVYNISVENCEKCLLEFPKAKVDIFKQLNQQNLKND